MTEEIKNLDALINKISFELVDSILKVSDKTTQKKLLNCIDKSLGVLSNDGVYAYYVYIKSQDKKKDNTFENIFLDKIKPVEAYCNIPLQDNNWQDFFEKLSEDLTSLLLFRDMLEKILIYARYHAKAMGG